MLHRKGFQPQLYADNLKCLSRDPGVLKRAARFTAGYVRLVGQEPAPSKCVLLSTSREIRRSMKDWVLSDSGYQWSVKFDVRDLGGHLETTLRGWSSTLAARVRSVIFRLALVFIPPLDFHGRVRVVRSMYLPAALHGIEASFLAVLLPVYGSFGPLSAGWFGHDVNPWLVLELCLVCLMGLLGVTVVGLVMVLSIFFLPVLLGLVLLRTLLLLLGLGLGCPFSVILLVLFSIFEQLFLTLGVVGLQLAFVAGLVLGVGLFWIFMALRSSLVLLMFGRGIRLCFVASWLVLCGTVFSLGRLGGLLLIVGFVVLLMVMVICFCLFPPLVEIRESPEFHDLMREDKSHWPRCLLWHGWLPMLSVTNRGSPWAADAFDAAGYMVETALGRYSSDRL